MTAWCVGMFKTWLWQKKMYSIARQSSYFIQVNLLTCWLINTGLFISGYIPTVLGASRAMDMYSSKVMIGNFPVTQKHTMKTARFINSLAYCKST